MTAMKPKNLLLVLISFCASSAFAAAPTISAFSPAAGALSSTVTITGTNFVAPATVKFNGVSSTIVTVVSSTTVTATVPTTASTGTITLTTSGGSAASTSAYTVIPGVGVTPSTVGPPTSAVTVYYSGFGAYETIDVYFDTGDIALSSASASGAGNIAVTIPASARPGSHWITASGRRSNSAGQIGFTVRSSWPQFGFAPNHKAKNHYENVLSAATVGDLDQAWQTPGIIDTESTPAVVNGIVYLGFGDASIRAFDETTGAQKWSYLTGGDAALCSPAVANGIVYVGSGDSYLYALDAVTGALKWRYLTGGAVFSSPNVTNGIVYFGSYDNKVYALNATTGAFLWSYTTGNVVFASPAVANGVVYAGSYDATVYALNAASGALIWSHATGGEIDGSPVLAERLVCVGSHDGAMNALDTVSGQLVWKYSTATAISSSPAAAGGTIFFGNDAANVYSLSADGSLRWSTALPSGGDILSPLCVANGVVYVNDGYDTYALDQNNGEILTALTGGSEYGGPAVVNGAVFAGDNSHGVLARYTPNALLSNFVAPRPDPMQLRPHPLR